jgi:transglutaminase-like putative cysteine protease
VLTTGCASLFRGYDPGALSPEYRQAFKEAMRVRPTKDSADYWQTPDETRTRGKGDCEDLAFLLEDEARRQGLAAPVEFGKAHVSNKTFHAWNEVRTPDGRRIVMDAFLGVWMVDPRPGYYVKYDMAKTDHAVGFLVNGLDYSLRKGGNAGPSQTFASAN